MSLFCIKYYLLYMPILRNLWFCIRNKIHCGAGLEIYILVGLILLHLFFGQTVNRKQLSTRFPSQSGGVNRFGCFKVQVVGLCKVFVNGLLRKF